MQDWIKNLGFAVLGGALVGGGMLLWKNRAQLAHTPTMSFGSRPSTVPTNSSQEPEPSKSQPSQKVETKKTIPISTSPEETASQELYKGKPVYRGKQGGKYYINSKGKKTYIRE